MARLLSAGQPTAHTYPLKTRKLHPVAETTRSTIYTPNLLNQYDDFTVGTSPAVVLDYDPDGNLTTWDDGTAAKRYTYDAENRLVTVEPAAPASGATKVVFLYDYLGRRIQKVVYQYVSGAWTQTDGTRFLYDGWNLVEERYADGQVKRFYVWGLELSGSLQGAGGIGGLVYATDGITNYRYLYDANGNVGQLVGASGDVAAHYEYDPFGRETYARGAVDNVFGFSTKYHDDETGLVYYGYRYYSPELGRWLNRDPIEELGLAAAGIAVSPREPVTKSSRHSPQAYALSLKQAAIRLRRTDSKHVVRIPSAVADTVNPYLFVLNNPISLLDLLGLRVEVWSHSVGLQSSGGSTGGGGPGFQHSSVRMYPDDVIGLLVGAPNVPLLQDQNGDAYVVLSAGPIGGLLVSALNRAADRHDRPNVRRGVVQPPAGMTDTDFILALLAADGRYGDNLDYDFCPPIQNGYNSNSYVSGLLRAVGATPPGLRGTRFPGWNQPVPGGNF
ncbi:MAG TPA: hypothetical protein ENK08_05820 [Chloroflexi bacterium]|nr:hypothetical protein [Chloroflexota bacterium]